MRASGLARDAGVALVYATIFALLAGWLLRDPLQSLERATYDWAVRARDVPASDRIAVIAIDDDSIRNLGRWPWPRDRHTEMLAQLERAGARVVASTVFFSEPEASPGREALLALKDQLARSPLSTSIPNEIDTFGLILDELATQTPVVEGLAQAWRASDLVTAYPGALAELRAGLDAALADDDADARLAEALKRLRGSLLPFSFVLGQPLGRPDATLPEAVRAWRLTRVEDRVGAREKGWLPLPTVSALVPLPVLAEAAGALGHLTTTLDVDGAVRFEPLVLAHFDEFYPSMSLAIAAAALNLKPEDLTLYLGEGLTLGGLRIGTQPRLLYQPHFYADREGRAPFPVYSFFDVKEGKIRPENFADRIVLIGATARGVGDTFPTPVAPAMAPVLQLAHVVSSLLQQHGYHRPSWAPWAEAGVYGVLLIWLALGVPRLSGTLAAAGTAFLVVLLLITQLSLLTQSALWLKLSLPALFVALGFAVMLLKRFNLTERLKQRSETESAESNRMLGLAFQGQGQLDMAFDKFKRVKPVDDALLDLLYNLALDFERKRQFNKAEAVYQYIAEHNKGFRDVQQKLGRARKLSETVIIGGASSHPGGTLVLDSTQKVEKPMLGRYEVEKELGKGAMGIVYLGRDPKIGRRVAIKTLSLSQTFEPDELASIKERFFREAETAGRLSHPHIVQIFDAGEEHDLAYIAMEFIEGHDLTRYGKPDRLLPVQDVLRLMAEAAEALDYAHRNGIVHRDIKPANMMLVEASRSIKLMDFGIARIADSSKTKTGLVLGTPSYMSPEQLAGKRVDGRSDLFSLGVTTYQLLTGTLPFTADSMATLMYRIATEPHAPLVTIRPDLPPGLGELLDRVLQKAAENRIQTGAEFASGLRDALAGLR